MADIIYSAGIVPVKFISDTYQFLILRKGNYWDFPKGKLEPGEQFLEAAIRETAEETTLTDIIFPWGHIYNDTEPYKVKTGNKNKKGRKIARYFLGRVMSGEPRLMPNPENGRVEHDEFRWLFYHQVKSLALTERIEDTLDWAQQQIERKA